MNNSRQNFLNQNNPTNQHYQVPNHYFQTHNLNPFANHFNHHFSIYNHYNHPQLDNIATALFRSHLTDNITLPPINPLADPQPALNSNHHNHQNHLVLMNNHSNIPSHNPRQNPWHNPWQNPWNNHSQNTSLNRLTNPSHNPQANYPRNYPTNYTENFLPIPPINNQGNSQRPAPQLRASYADIITSNIHNNSR
jgi:hypothetical protein